MIKPMFSEFDIVVKNTHDVEFPVDGPAWVISGERVHPDKMDEFGEKIGALYKEYSMNLPEEYIPTYSNDE